MKKIKIDSFFWLYSVLLLLSLWTRWFDVDRLGLWSDELSSVFYSFSPQNSLLDVHTPLFYLTTVFGLELIGPNELGMRFSSLIASSLLLIFLFYQVLNKREARWIWFYILFCFSGLDWVLSREARMYELMVLFSTLSFLFGLKFSENATFKKWFLLTLFLALNSFNHVTALVFNVSLVLFFGLKKRALWGRFSLSSSLTLSSIPVLVYYLSADRLESALSRGQSIPAISWSWPWQLWTHLLGAKSPYFEFQNFVYPLALLIGFVTICFFASWKKRSFQWASPVLIILFYHSGHLVLFPFLNFLNLRYFSALLPIVLWVGALALEKTVRLRKLYVLALASLLLFVNTLGLNVFAPKSGLRELYEYSSQVNADEQLILCDYGRMRSSQQIFYPDLASKAVYCYEFVRYYFKILQAPERLKVISSLSFSEDFESIRDFLSQNYVLENVEQGPNGMGVIRYYAKR
jgi:hypothetical protein